MDDDEVMATLDQNDLYDVQIVGYEAVPPPPSAAVGVDAADEDDDVEIVDKPAPPPHAEADGGEGDADDVQFVGRTGDLALADPS